MNTAPSLLNRPALVAETEATLKAMALPCLSLAAAVAAALICCAATPVLAHEVNAGSMRVLLALLTLPLWLCLLVVFGASLLAGAFDGLTQHRSLQAAGVLLAVSALAYLIGRGALAQQTVPLVVLPPLALVAAAALRWWPRG
ncbi:hypothetical protein [Aquabacterium sp.]|uniref:hypothetical protein n=1 Tax=Aquabacterium sp. TaxID=1872578 RepID=UPI002D162C6D|nr:hypothetical protein [Aquabacterium sp.]HSW05580.1 hypothetical protein [Aquabacterium sp.]